MRGAGAMLTSKAIVVCSGGRRRQRGLVRVDCIILYESRCLSECKFLIHKMRAKLFSYSLSLCCEEDTLSNVYAYV